MSELIYILGIATFVQVFYYLFFYSRILFYKPNQKQTLVHQVSVIVCAHNEIEHLKKLIPAILAQKFECFEFILADDRSEDGTFEFFTKKYGEEGRFKMIRIEANREGKNFKKYALTKAIEAARYDTVLLTDADCIPVSSDWIAEMAGSLGEGKEIVLGYSPYEEKSGLLNLLIRFETLYTAIQYFSFALAGFPYMGVGRNLLYKKSLFVNNKGFSSHIQTTGGDDDLFIREVAQKENVAIGIQKSAQTVSVPKEDYFEWFRQKRRHLSVGTQYHWKHKILLGMQMITHLLFYASLGFVFFIDYRAAFLFLMIRGLVFVVIFVLIARKLGEKCKCWAWLILIDLAYIFNYLLITISLVIYKKVKWN